MSEAWYETVEPSVPLTQGDMIFDCPLVGWENVGQDPGGQARGQLDELICAFREDVVVVTQACDLEHRKVENVVLCPHVSLPRVFIRIPPNLAGMDGVQGTESIGESLEKNVRRHCQRLCLDFRHCNPPWGPQRHSHLAGMLEWMEWMECLLVPETNFSFPLALPETRCFRYSSPPVN